VTLIGRTACCNVPTHDYDRIDVAAPMHAPAAGVAPPGQPDRQHAADPSPSWVYARRHVGFFRGCTVQQPGLSAPDFATWKTIERYRWSN
jgi:hypothetical protein